MEKEGKKINKIKLMVTIVDRGLGDEVVELCHDNGVTFNMVAPGYGAAGMDIVDFLGLTDTENDIVLSVVQEPDALEVLKMIKYKFDLDEAGTGLAFTIPISGVSGPLAFKYISGTGKKPD